MSTLIAAQLTALLMILPFILGAYVKLSMALSPKKLITVISMLSFVTLSGCSTVSVTNKDWTPSPSEYALRDHGNMSIEEYKKYFTETLPETFKDPEAVRLRFTDTLVKAYCRMSYNSAINAGKLYWGWESTIRINAKNGYGGYIGYSTQTFFLAKNNEVYFDSTPSHYQCKTWNGKIFN